MERIYFVFFLIVILIFLKLNYSYKKTHDDKSILNESKVKKTVAEFAFMDDLYRIISDASLFAA